MPKENTEDNDLEVVAEHEFICKSCPSCGRPFYIDGCLKCGHRPGDFLENERGA